MRVLLVVALLVVTVLLVTESSLIKGSVEEDIQILEVKIRVLHDLLAKDCPSYNSRAKRQADTENQRHLDVQMIVYDKLFKKWIECQNSKLATPSTSTSKLQLTTGRMKFNATGKVTSPTTERKGFTTRPTLTTEQQTPKSTMQLATPTTESTVTTNVKQTTDFPSTHPCKQAVNYTQSWRRDHSGSDIRPGGPNSANKYACDFHRRSTQWFRFSGAAGTHMLDSCPKYLSCGTNIPYWTNQRMPQEVGVETAVKVYGVLADNCRWFTASIQVMRCSIKTANDFIYRQTTNYSYPCGEAFCGMM